MIRISGNVGKLLEKILGCTILTTKCRITLTSVPDGDINTFTLILPSNSELEEMYECYKYLKKMYFDMASMERVYAEMLSNNILKITSRRENRIFILETLQFLIDEGPWVNIVPSLLLNTYLTKTVTVMDFSFFAERDCDILVVDKLKCASAIKLKKMGFNFSHILPLKAETVEIRKSNKKLGFVDDIILFDEEPISNIINSLNRIDKEIINRGITEDQKLWLYSRRNDNRETTKETLAETTFLTTLPWVSPIKIWKPPTEVNGSESNRLGLSQSKRFLLEDRTKGDGRFSNVT